jgi:hypothetical protein
MRKTQTQRDRSILESIRTFATMENRALGERWLRDYLRAIRDGKLPFGHRAKEVAR